MKSQVRWILLASLSVSAPAFAEDIPRLPNGEPILRMPTPAGSVVLCQQGNKSPKGYSHSAPNCLHALDLSNPARAKLPIVAAAAGTVRQIVTDSSPGDTKRGYGFGNLVKVDHGRGYHSLYAHLSTVSVKPGQAVVAGQELGIMGRTGRAGNAHLHFSLHRGDPEGPGAAITVPIHALIAADLNISADFQLFTSLELVGAGAKVSAEGHLYASENRREQLIIGPAEAELRRAIKREERDLRRRLGSAESALALSAIVKDWPKRGAAWARPKLEALIASEDNDEARYWLATMLLSARPTDLARARAALTKILGREDRLSGHPWILPWSHLRLAQVEEKEGQTEAALRALEKTLSYPDDGPRGYTAAAKALRASLAKGRRKRRF